MPSNPLLQEIQTAKKLAKEAGMLAMQYYQQPLEIDYKNNDPSNPVTQADKQANALIVEGLRQAFPDDGLLAEESLLSDTRHQHARLWCVDPIDGTREFIAGNGQFMVMIGLAIDTRAALGVLYQPTEDLLLVGVHHGPHTLAYAEQRGSTRDIHVSSISHLVQATMMVSRMRPSLRVNQLMQSLGVTRTHASGSIGLKIAYVAQGLADIYVSTSQTIHEWDTCAPEAVLIAAGGCVSDLLGEPLRYNKPKPNTPTGILVTNAYLQASCLKSTAELAVL